MSHITVKKDVFHLAFAPDNKVTARASSGDTVTFQCRDCYNGELNRDGMDFADMDMSCNNPATGALYIEDAQPGDVLRVDIEKIDLEDHGCMCARLNCGVYEIEGCHCRIFNIRDRKIDFDGISIPIKPMIGVIGTATADEPVSTQSPGKHGGNMDIRDLGEGVRLYLPVNVPGALLSMGDLHAVQGDGETVICALECFGEVTVKIQVLKNRKDIPTPFILTPTHFITTSADVSLDVCSVKAARKMHHFITDHSSLTDAQAGMLLSLQGNLRISQVVNPRKGCIMDFPRALAPITFEE